MRMIVDIVVIGILLFFLISGLRRGLIRQILQIVGIVAGFIGAFYLAHHVARHLDARFGLEYRLSVIVSAVAIFVGIVVLFHFLGLGLQKIAQISLMGSLDRIGGAVLGLVKGALVVSLLCVIALSLPLPAAVRDEMAGDPLVAALYPILPVLFNVVVSRTPAGLAFANAVDRAADGGAFTRAKGAIGEVKKAARQDEQ